MFKISYKNIRSGVFIVNFENISQLFGFVPSRKSVLIQNPQM